MSVIATAILLVIAAAPQAVTTDSCLNEATLLQMDAGWERALLEGDGEHLEQLLADEFVWVHTHASVIDSKESVLAAMSAESGWTSRVQSGVEIRRLGSTAVVTGFTVVSRKDGSNRYHFMRTYAETPDGCFLLGNQTMAIPKGE